MRHFISLLLVLSHLSLFAQLDLQSGLLACYQFSGSAIDGSGNNRHGSVHGATLTVDRFGAPNSAYEFDGISDRISVPAQALLNNHYTYSLWAQLHSLPSPGESHVVFSIGDATAKHQTVNFSNAYGGISTGVVAGGFNNGTPPTTSVQTGILPVVNRWYHIVSVRTSTTLSLYVDGVLIGTESTNATTPYYGSSAIANIGIRCNLVQPFHGRIDDVTIYNRALSVAEVRELYEHGVACATIPSPVVSDAQRCGNGAVTLTAAGGSLYRWYNASSGGNLIFEGNPYTTGHLTGSTDFYVASVVGNTESSRTKVVVTLYPQPSITLYSRDTTIAGVSELFRLDRVSGTAPFSYMFSFGDGAATTTSIAESFHSYTRKGIYPVEAWVEDSKGCTTSAATAILVLDPDFQTFDVTRCGEGTTALTASGGDRYRWYNVPAGGNVVFEGNPFVTPHLSATTSYFVSAVIGTVESARKKATVIVVPQPELACRFIDITSITQAERYEANVAFGTAPYRYTFQFGDDPPVETSSSFIVYQPTRSGTLEGRVTVVDANGCPASCNALIEVLNGDILIPNVITPGHADNLNDTFTLFLRNNDNQYTFYDGIKNFSLRILNRWGKQIFFTSNSVTGWRAKNDENGIYFYDIRLGDRSFKGWIDVRR